jgi:hypothetical protein
MVALRLLPGLYSCCFPGDGTTCFHIQETSYGSASTRVRKNTAPTISKFGVGRLAISRCTNLATNAIHAEG